MATYEGARALGFEETGRIEPGWKADLALVDLDRPHYVGVNEDNLGCYLVYAGSKADVKSTIISGKPVYSDGRLLNFDKDEIILSARKESQRLVE
jgi:5-methylthioadenosine/S-adenosylhomocysteine deaminase